MHSPFAFQLITKCFHDKTQHPEYQTLGRYRKDLLRNPDTITITDYGAGSKVFTSNERNVRDMVKTVGISPKRAELLFRLVNYFKPVRILELGTSLGLATSALYLGNPKAQIISLEGCKNTLAVAQKEFELCFGKQVFENVALLHAEFDTYLEEIDLSVSKTTQEEWDLVYLDGNHTKSATLKYVVKLLPYITNNTIWVFDDIHWSRDMEKAWEYIKAMPEVKVSMDTFQWGLVFFRKEQKKQHFTIRL